MFEVDKVVFHTTRYSLCPENSVLVPYTEYSEGVLDNFITYIYMQAQCLFDISRTPEYSYCTAEKSICNVYHNYCFELARHVVSIQRHHCICRNVDP
jgi:hypothetical protein